MLPFSYHAKYYSFVVVTNATCLTKSDRGLRNLSRLGARIFTPVVSLSFDQHAGDSTVSARFHPYLEGENLEGGQGPPTPLPLPPTTREDLWLDGYLGYPHAAKALHIYIHPCLLRDSNLVPTAPQSKSLITIPVRRQYHT
ncbi:uncharacterized protein TNCV_1022831 [Trichonephila clavipes]|nr:uncharacterized protein TNCV_1022831 [Trichonephila clavipes]